MTKYVAIDTTIYWTKDQVYDIELVFSEDYMEKLELNYNFINIYFNGEHIAHCIDTVLSISFKLLADIRQERIEQILKD